MVILKHLTRMRLDLVIRWHCSNMNIVVDVVMFEDYTRRCASSLILVFDTEQELKRKQFSLYIVRLSPSVF